MMSDAMGTGSHPNRPLPSMEVRLAADAAVMEHAPDLLMSAAEGIDDVLAIMGRGGTFDETLLDQAGSLTAIEDHFRLPNGQVSIESLLGVMEEHDFASPAKPAFVLVGSDLKAEGTNFVFGVTRKRSGVSLQSTRRFERGIRDRLLLRKTIRHIARHEFGHLMGLDEGSIRNRDKRGGIYEGHCASGCTMQQVMSVSQAADHARKLSHEPHAGFCADCVSVLRLHR